MSDTLPQTQTIPTELGRADVYWDLAAVFGGGLFGAWLYLYRGVPFWMVVVALAPVAFWSLTGEPAGDVGWGVGAIATGLRSKLGARRGHEWLLAYLHYFRVAVRPRLEHRWLTSKLGSRIATWRCWQTLASISGARLNSRRLLSWRPR